MALRTCCQRLRLAQPIQAPQSLRQSFLRSPALRFYSSSADSPPPPLLQKLKADVKIAMRAKDSQRLAVLRAILATAINASKTDSPIRTDAQLVALLRKSQRASNEAAASFRDAGREDLATKEDEQANIMQEYVAGSGIEVLGEAELEKMVKETVDEIRSDQVAEKSVQGAVMKKLIARLSEEGKEVDKKVLAGLVKDAVSSSS